MYEFKPPNRRSETLHITLYITQTIFTIPQVTLGGSQLDF